MKLNLLFMGPIILTFLSQIICQNDLLAQANYIKTFELENGKILFCTEKGIRLSDENLNQILITNDTEFEADVYINDFDFVTISQFEEGEKYIIVAYKKVIFIFSSEGEYFTKGNIDFDPKGRYYTLVPYKIISTDLINEYYFIIGYIGNGEGTQLLFSDFCLDKISRNLYLKRSIFIDLTIVSTSYNGFSCNKMKSKLYNEVITCFFQVGSNLIVSSFNLENLTSINNLYLVKNTGGEPINIKSVIDTSKSRALICYLEGWYASTCEKYDINGNNLTFIQINTYDYERKCKNSHPSTTIIYNPKKVNEYIFGCLGDQKDLVFIKFNSNFEIVSLIPNKKYYINNTDDTHFILSIVKLPNQEKYSLLISYEKKSFIFKNDIPEGLNPGINVNESISTGKLMSYLIMDNTNYIIKYSTHLIKNSIGKNFDIEESKNIFEQNTQNFFTENLYHTETENLTKENFNTYNIIENFTTINYNQKSSITTNTNELKNDQNKNNIKEKIENFLNNKINKTKEVEIEKDEYDKIIEMFEDIFTSSNFDTSNLEKGEDYTRKIGKISFTLTTTENQKNNTKDNITAIDLGECETLLRNYYNISNESKLFMKKMDITQEGMKIPKIEYDVYSKLNGTNLIKLNLSICENTKISISVPVILTEDIDKLNTSSDYFKDICYISKSESGTDIILKDRKKEFIDQNKTVCQEECDFSDYDYDIQKANCSCLVKESSSSISDMNINLIKLNEKFGNINNETELSNLGITSCNVLESTDNIESNAGFYSLLFIIVIFIIIFIIFCCKGYHLLENQIDEVIYKKFKDDKKQKRNNMIKENLISSKKNKKINKKKRNQKQLQKKIKSINSKNNIINNEDIINKNSRNNKSIIEIKDNKNKNIKFPSYKPDTDYEFNWLSYEDALRYDKRSNCEYYGSLIRSKQLFMFTFCSFNDYNSGIIKKFIFFLSFALHYTVNALFFNDSNLHQIYEDEGKFNFSFQLPYILYSALISTFVLRLILQILVLTDKDLLEVKKQINKESAINMKKKN